MIPRDLVFQQKEWTMHILSFFPEFQTLLDKVDTLVNLVKLLFRVRRITADWQALNGGYVRTRTRLLAMFCWWNDFDLRDNIWNFSCNGFWRVFSRLRLSFERFWNEHGVFQNRVKFVFRALRRNLSMKVSKVLRRLSGWPWPGRATACPLTSSEWGWGAVFASIPIRTLATNPWLNKYVRCRSTAKATLLKVSLWFVNRPS